MMSHPLELLCYKFVSCDGTVERERNSTHSSLKTIYRPVIQQIEDYVLHLLSNIRKQYRDNEPVKPLQQETNTTSEPRVCSQ